jgi:DNA polymerase I-like protein with 3'-5' exonuclease and polymerase domains
LSLPFDRIITLDFETAWDRSSYTLSKMTTEEYVRDPRFKAWGLCWKDTDMNAAPWTPDSRVEYQSVWVRRDRIRRWAASVDWSRTAVLAHNAQFDVTILSWVYGIQPAFIFDTLSMARALRGIEVGNSLAKLAEDFGLPPKGKAVHSTDGMLDEIPFLVEQELADYCRHDTWLCEQVFLRLLPGYPAKELRLIDMTMKMYTRPLLQLDADMLEKAIDEERTTREGLLQRIGVEEAALASNQKFAEVLTTLGVDPPTKKSKTTGEDTFAFAKNDALFQALLNSDNEDVALLCEARLRVKSTSERTRAQRFLDIASRGSLPVPLSYYGAGTGRWTAAKGSAINMQNLKRGSFLRKAIMAPEGHVLVVGDLSQIEPRVLAWLSDNQALLDIFRSGDDPYAQFGAQMFGIPGMTKESHPVERQSAKSALLGAGYQLGWASFAAQLLTGFLGAPPKRYTRDEAKLLGVTGADVHRFLDWEENVLKMAEIPHTCTDEELLIHCLAAKAIIDKYRAASPSLTDADSGFWGLMGSLIEHSLYKGSEYQHKCLLFRKGEIILPSGMPIRYPDLRPEQDAKGRVQWTYADGKKRVKLYAGKVTNNVTQGVARCVMTDGMLRVAKRYPVVGTVHDEQIAVAPENEAEEAKTWVLAQMIAPVKYMPGIPLNADVGAHKRYGLAKS